MRANDVDDAAMARDRAARKAGSRAAADQRHIVRLREPHDSDHVRSRAREHDAIRPRHLDRAIVLVKQQVLGPRAERRRGPSSFLQIVEKSRIHGVARQPARARLRPL